MQIDERTNLSLAFVVTLQVALVTAIAMALYAIMQYFTMPGHTVGGLIVEHGWHVIVLGILTYLAIYLVLHNQVIKPIKALYLKCYAVTRGDLTPVSLDSRIKEIQEIADGINMMVERIPDTPSDVQNNDLAYDGEHLRDFVTAHESLTPDDKDYLLKLAVKLEQSTDPS